MQPGSLLCGLWLRQVQDAAESLETLLHILVVGWPSVQPAGIIWGYRAGVSMPRPNDSMKARPWESGLGTPVPAATQW